MKNSDQCAMAFATMARARLDYDPETGILRWKPDTFLNSSKAGLRAGCQNPDGYRYLDFNGRRRGEHRIIWVLVYAEFPEQVDHINMIKNDNRLCNLRAATIAQNGMNRQKQVNNTSGFKGVSLNKMAGKYNAKITFNKVKKHLGSYDTPEAAADAYKQAAEKFHGSFARA